METPVWLSRFFNVGSIARTTWHFLSADGRDCRPGKDERSCYGTLRVARKVATRCGLVVTRVSAGQYRVSRRTTRPENR